jgi:hypothetical protein
MARNLLTKKSIKFGGESREKVMRVPFGLGAPADAGPESAKAAEKCLRCGFGNVPVVEEVVWTVPLPLTAEQAQTTFGDTINPLSGSSSVPGVASIDSTFLINGILQTDILAQGIGVHVFCEPMSFSTIGNAFTAPDTALQESVPSPDVFTLNDALNGALGAPLSSGNEAPVPSVFEWGAATWRAGWNFINAYQFQWKTSQRELVLNELAADISYFGSFADAEASGTSELPIIEFVALLNAQYRAQESQTIFLPVNFRRVGSVNSLSATNNVGIFHPTRDFDLAPVTWGGLRWQGYGCRGQMYRPVESPCFLERGIPIGMIFIAQDAVHQAQMIEALTIDNEPFGFNVQPDINVGGYSAVGGAAGAGVPTTGAITAGVNNVMLEQTLDATPVLVQQSVNATRQVFKGGIFKLGVKIKGWEMPGGWKSYCQTNLPQVMRHNSAG